MSGDHLPLVPDGDRRVWSSTPAGGRAAVSCGLEADFQGSSVFLRSHSAVEASLHGSDDHMKDDGVKTGPAFTFHAQGNTPKSCSGMDDACAMDEGKSLDPMKMVPGCTNCMPGLTSSSPVTFCVGLADHRSAGYSAPVAQHACTSCVCPIAVGSCAQQKSMFSNDGAHGKPWGSISSAWKKPKVIPMPSLGELGRFSEDGLTALLDEDAVNVTLRKLESALVGRMFGRRIPYSQLSIELKRRWEAFGGFRLVMLSRDCFLCIFDKLEACEAVLMGGPWVVLGQVLGIDRWSSSFSPSSSEGFKTPVWIRMPGLPLYCWNSKNIARISALIGEPLWLDPATEHIDRGMFARACIRIDLSKPLRLGVWVAGIHGRFFQPLEYEGLSLFCFRCSQVGHKVHSCKLPNPSGVNDHGPIGSFANGNMSTSSAGCAGRVQANCVRAGSPTPNGVRHDAEQVLVQQTEDRGAGPWMLVSRRKNSKNANGAKMLRNQLAPTTSTWTTKARPGSSSMRRAGAFGGQWRGGHGSCPLPPPKRPSQPPTVVVRDVLGSGKPRLSPSSWADSAENGRELLQPSSSASLLGKFGEPPSGVQQVDHIQEQEGERVVEMQVEATRDAPTSDSTLVDGTLSITLADSTLPSHLETGLLSSSMPLPSHLDGTLSITLADSSSMSILNDSSHPGEIIPYDNKVVVDRMACAGEERKVVKSLKVERMLNDLGPISMTPRKRRMIVLEPDGGDASPSPPP